ncbi:hypothetical protein HDU76_010278, partial [Blyttiomyces sp. JEL0837]
EMKVEKEKETGMTRHMHVNVTLNNEPIRIPTMKSYSDMPVGDVNHGNVHTDANHLSSSRLAPATSRHSLLSTSQNQLFKSIGSMSVFAILGNLSLYGITCTLHLKSTGELSADDTSSLFLSMALNIYFVMSTGSKLLIPYMIGLYVLCFLGYGIIAIVTRLTLLTEGSTIVTLILVVTLGIFNIRRNELESRKFFALLQFASVVLGVSVANSSGDGGNVASEENGSDKTNLANSQEKLEEATVVVVEDANG